MIESKLVVYSGEKKQVGPETPALESSCSRDAPESEAAAAEEDAANTKDNLDEVVNVAGGECLDAVAARHLTSLTLLHLLVCCLASGEMAFFVL